MLRQRKKPRVQRPLPYLGMFRVRYSYLQCVQLLYYNAKAICTIKTRMRIIDFPPRVFRAIINATIHRGV
jgi:hypothetical protein